LHQRLCCCCILPRCLSLQVLHSDLKVRNVLLKSDASARGCIAKVADFGLAVRMDCMDTHVSAFQVRLWVEHITSGALHGIAWSAFWVRQCPCNNSMCCFAWYCMDCMVTHVSAFQVGWCFYSSR
jgi:serine/threonine protein kinase